MGLLQEFTIDQLGGSIALILGSLGGLLLIIWKSKCKRINCCYLLQCERQVDQDSDDETTNKKKKEIKKEEDEEDLITDTELNRKLNENILLRERLKQLALMNEKPNISLDVTPRAESVASP
tara:strand:+ start:2247 stop:2612 length:366 start_codon:yes stop_codon:yes gene_type:complete